MLKLHKVSYSYKLNQVIHSISLQLVAGKVFGIIGESGSGKTTLLKLLAGLLEPQTGEVLLENKPILKPSEKLIAGNDKIKMVTQSNSLFPNISIFENISYELRYYNTKYKDARTIKLLKIAGILHLKDRLPKEVSGGELQRALIIKAIADEPKVLLLDEPFSNLDVNNKAKLKEILSTIISTEKIACALVTHDINDAFGMADELAIIQRGRIIQSGKTKLIYDKPKSRYVGNISGIGNIFDFEEFQKIFETQDFEGKYVFIRPENIRISENGRYLGEIRACKFFGSYHQIEVVFEKLALIAYQKNAIEVGQKVNFDILNWVTVK